MEERTHVLHLDDDGQVRALVRKMLQKNGFAVDSCGTIAEFKAAYDPQRYPLAILDGSVERDNDGGELAIHLRDEGRNVMTYSTLKYGAVPGVLKPSNFNQLVDTAKKLTQKR
jgi:DNA-binding response OmpR family regulator